MPELSVQKCVVIQAALDRVYASVRSFRDWIFWCPWLAIQPDCERHFLADHSGFAWEGAVAGEGRIEVLEEDGPRSLRLKLSRLKPWKWQGELGFKFRDLGAGRGVELTWSLEGALPLGRLREAEDAAALLGSEAGLGLALLQGTLSAGGAPCKLESPGRVLFPGGRFLGVRGPSGNVQDSEAISAAFGNLAAWMGEHKIAALGPRTFFCPGWDVGKGPHEVIAAVQVGKGREKTKGRLPSDFVVFDVPGGKAELVRLTGPPEYVLLAWAAARARVDAYGFERWKSADPFVVCEKGHSGAASLAVYLPVK
jgi:hypothetical protein